MGTTDSHSFSQESTRPSLARTYRYLVSTSLVGTFLLMLVGGFTMAIGAGMSCPGWPLCYGSYVPFLHPVVLAQAPYTEVQIFAEWFHRLLALLVGLLILATGVVAWRMPRRPVLRWSGIAALVLLPIQAALGAWTVVSGNAPLIVVVHLGTAMLLFAALTVSTTAAWDFSPVARIASS